MSKLVLSSVYPANQTLAIDDFTWLCQIPNSNRIARTLFLCFIPLLWLLMLLWFTLHVPGGNMRDSFLVDGFAGFEQQPKKFLNLNILLLNIKLELKSEKENTDIRLAL
ncbi:unnamed protein product [Brassica rapa subsp. trilocularis]